MLIDDLFMMKIKLVISNFKTITYQRGAGEKESNTEKVELPKDLNLMLRVSR